MKAEETICIRLTIDEYRYAMALSKRVEGCQRPKIGSVAHGLKWCLREQAKKENIQLG